MREGCAALGRRLHREVDNGYTVDRERGGLLGGTTAVLPGEKKIDYGCTAWRESWTTVTLLVARGLYCWVGKR